MDNNVTVSVSRDPQESQILQSFVASAFIADDFFSPPINGGATCSEIKLGDRSSEFNTKDPESFTPQSAFHITLLPFCFAPGKAG